MSMVLERFLSLEYPPNTYILLLNMSENPVERGVGMGVTCLHFSKLANNPFTFLDAVLFAGTEQLILLVPAPENEDVPQLPYLEMRPHMRVPFLTHAT
jgi:hypothetical protein